MRFKILQALGRLQATHPSTDLDADLLNEQLRESLLRAIQLLQWRDAIESNGMPETPDGELLRVALRDKENATLERAFWMMGLLNPKESFALVWRGLKSDNARLHAASVEVLEATLSGGFREAVLALVDEGEVPARRARAAATALGATVRPVWSYEEAMRAMVEDTSEVVRGIAVHHAAELEKRGELPESHARKEVTGIV